MDASSSLILTPQSRQKINGDAQVPSIAMKTARDGASTPTSTAPGIFQTPPLTPTSERYNHIHSMLMSNLELMKEKFVRAHREMMTGDAKRDVTTSPSHRGTPAMRSDLFAVNSVVQHVAHEVLNETPVSPIIVPAAPIGDAAPHDDKLQNALLENTQLREQIQKLQHDLDTQHELNRTQKTENAELHSDMNSLHAGMDALRRDNEALKTRIEDMHAERSEALAAESSQQEETLQKVQSSLEEANQQIAKLEMQLKELNELNTTRDSQHAQQLEEQRHEYETKVRTLEERDTTQREQLQRLEEELETLRSAPVQQQPEVPVPTPPKPSPNTAKLERTIEYLSEENDNLLDMVRSYETLLESLSQKVSITQQNQKMNHATQVADLERKVETLQKDIYKQMEENFLLEEKLGIALETLKQAYLLRCEELAQQDQELPTLHEENQVLRELLMKRHLEIAGK